MILSAGDLGIEIDFGPKSKPGMIQFSCQLKILT
jgi:hypothetical protein